MKGTAHRASTAHPAITFIGRLALAALILVVLVEVYFLARGFNLYREAIEEAGLDEMAASIQSSESFTPIDELPDLYLQAVVAVEDHRFYAHPGFDAIATARALVNDLKAGAIVEGGSTITQQLAKNQYFTQEQTVERKIAEVFMALTMEQHFSKRTILELYVNSIYFGDGYEGIGSASWGYFGKAPSALDADECTLLAGIPNAPSVYALSQNPGLARERQQEVLRKLVSYDYLGQDAAQHILGNLRALAGRYLALPVAYDHEPVADGAGRANNMDRETLTACARAFCERLEQGGYETMIYGNSGDMARYDRADLGGRPVWFAEYDAAEPHAQFDFAIWQYTNGGSVAGIGTAVDLNLLLPPAK